MAVVTGICYKPTKYATCNLLVGVLWVGVLLSEL